MTRLELRNVLPLAIALMSMSDSATAQAQQPCRLLSKSIFAMPVPSGFLMLTIFRSLWYNDRSIVKRAWQCELFAGGPGGGDTSACDTDNVQPP